VNCTISISRVIKSDGPVGDVAAKQNASLDPIDAERC